MATFKMELPSEDKSTKYKLTDEIEVPAGKAFKFQVQLYEQWKNEDCQISGRNILYFTFKFNNNVSVITPLIFLNCKGENEEGRTLEYLD